MATNISPAISGSTTMGGFMIRVEVHATTTLQETDPGKFQFLVQYQYSGTMKGSGSVPLPVSGNVSSSYDVGHGVRLNYAVTNWTLTSTSLSCTVDASIEHTSFPHLGPDFIYNHVQFAGPLAHVQAARNEQLKARSAELEAALHKAIGVSASALRQA
ncbi:hypothetical protein [Sorangium sp. So ce861]|uniref:hypothetical protein n=1 Tax=Sorangium sp. So ce861 TaxID=3133323 RepID=UPI003F648288